MPSAEANSATLPKWAITDSVFIGGLKHTLLCNVKHTLKNRPYHWAMSTLAERVLEAIEATGLDVPDLAKKVGVSKQAVYDWKKGVSLAKIKGENLVELADLAGYEALWIMKGKGLKKKTLTTEQEKLLLAMQQAPTHQQNLITDIVESVIKHQVDCGPAQVREERRHGEADRRKQDVGHNSERRFPYSAPNFPQKTKIYTDRRRKEK